jgi:ATP-dependent Lon protease
MISDFLKI